VRKHHEEIAMLPTLALSSPMIAIVIGRVIGILKKRGHHV
jgi:hypothetical protein